MTKKDRVELKQRGVYLIVNHANGKVYVGSTHVTFKDRWKSHVDNLRNQKHGNPYLQAAWNKYGEPMFEFMILEVIDDESNIIEAEQFYLDIFFGNGNYNINPVANSTAGRVTTVRTKNYYVYSPDGEKIGPITNAAHFARTQMNVSTMQLYNLLNGYQNTLKGWTRAYELTDLQKERIDQRRNSNRKRNKERKLELGLPVRDHVGRPELPKDQHQAVIDYSINNPCASLRRIAKFTGIQYITVRNILKRNNLDYQRTNCDYKETAHASRIPVSKLD